MPGARPCREIFLGEINRDLTQEESYRAICLPSPRLLLRTGRGNPPIDRIAPAVALPKEVGKSSVKVLISRCPVERVSRVARKLRVQYAGAIYHVMNRGDRREEILRDDEDRQRLLSTLGEACAKTGLAP